MDSSVHQHWLVSYLPDVSSSEITRISIDEDYKTQIIAKLAHVLGADFHQYVAKPKDYSAKSTKWSFIPNGGDTALLFFPDYIYDTLGEKMERQISQLFDVRIKYVSKPVQL